MIHPVIEAYKSHLRNKVESGERRKGIHVSDLVGDCLRKPWYRMAGIPIELSDDSITNFYYGTVIHESFEGMFETMEYKLYVNPFKNKKLKESFIPEGKEIYRSVSGSLDAIYNNEMIIDFKTCSKFPSQPGGSYVRQINFYSYMYYVHTGIEIKKGGILYISKSEQFKTKLFEFDLLPLDVNRGLMQKAILEIEDEAPPERVPTPLCTDCPFVTDCKPKGYYNYKEKRMIY